VATHEKIGENIGEECLKSLTCSKIGQKSEKIGVMNGVMNGKKCIRNRSETNKQLEKQR
jgi:hypothetical protein